VTPDVDVVIPVRNGGRLLRSAVDSVLAQEGVRVRVLVVDDGSTDGAPQRLPRDDRVVVVTNEGSGEVDAHNTAMKHARAPWVARQDADDESLPGRLQAQAAYLSEHAGIGLVATAFEVVVGGRKVSVMRTQPGGMLHKNRICAGSTMVRRDLLIDVGGYRRAFLLSSDYDTWLRCAEAAGIAILPLVGYRYRLHAGMSTIRLASIHPPYSLLARESARARLAGRPDPVDAAEQWLAERQLAVGEQRLRTAEVNAWWAREFAALGSRRDAWQCLRRTLPLGARRVAFLAGACLATRRPQSEWS
jgi:glycosyltransferase involved in cell wall biosynthesis